MRLFTFLKTLVFSLKQALATRCNFQTTAFTPAWQACTGARLLGIDRRFQRLITISFVVAGLSGCSILQPNRTVELASLPGWMDDDLNESWQAWLKSCDSGKLPDTAQWRGVCLRAQQLKQPNDAQTRTFFEQNFVARRARDVESGRRTGLITGYYEPQLRGNRTPTPTYRWPIYGRPDDLVTIDLGELYPELANKRVRGRLDGQRVVPYVDRSQIDGELAPLAGNELLWLDDPIDVFFLHVQGSGRVVLPDGSFIKVGYADQNGHRYVSIGRTLVELEALKLKDVSLQSIRQWLKQNPDQAQEVLNSNPSYVFFDIKTDSADTPAGALGVPLTPRRSIAVDKRYVPAGSPVWLDTDLPNTDEQPFRRLTFAQDTGGAIKGGVRADVFFGRGDEAEDLAGHMKQKGRMWVLQPRPVP